jgi:hypothetical protein
MSEQPEDPRGGISAEASGPDPETEPTVPLGTETHPEEWGPVARQDYQEHRTRPPGGTAGMPEGVPDRRPLSVSHLVTGLVFVGISGLWLAQEVGVVEVEDMDFLVPLLLVVVGAAGLLAGLLRAARRD